MRHLNIKICHAIAALLLSVTTVAAEPDCPAEQNTPDTPWHNCFGDGLTEDGSHYLGPFRHGKFHGQGTLYLVNGDRYVGEFQDNHFNGFGLLTLSKGDIYSGTFKHSQPNGIGKYIFVNGAQYIGEFKDGQFHGKGVHTSNAGAITAGIWKNGEPLFEEKATKEEITDLEFLKGANEYETQAIALGLSELIVETLKFYLTESHFIHGPRCPEKTVDCRQQLRFDVNFRTSTFDLNIDGVDEVFVWYEAPGACGSGGCYTYILKQELKGWDVIGEFFPGGKVAISSNTTNGYLDFYYYGKSDRYSCKFELSDYNC
jgi:hypothetical protein